MVWGMQSLYPILASQFELKIGLLNIVTAISFHGFKNNDPHSHIRRFTKITQTVKLNQVPHDIIKLILFLFSLEGAARTWLEKEPPNSITTWNDLVSKFVNRFFPPSRSTNLLNEIIRFQQICGETFFEAWDLFKDPLNKCPHHSFTPLHQIDTFYNSLNQSDQDSPNSAVGVSSASGSSTQDVAITALTKQVEALVSSMNRPINSIQNGYETCGGPHAYYECQAIGGYTQDVYATSWTYNSGEVEKELETLMDEVHITSPASTAHVPPPGIQPVSPPKPKEDPKPNPHQPNIQYPLRLNKIKLLDKNDVQVSKFLKILKQLHFDINLMDALTQILKYHKVLKDLLKDKVKLAELANTPINAECSAILLNKVPEKPNDPGKFLIRCV
ncbi:reverse transcriptase domain-containing protein [Tanacetum coccineum]